MRSVLRLSALDIMADLRRRRLRLVFFLVKMWVLKALRRFILPVAVRLKRFAAAFLVFTFGTVSSIKSFAANVPQTTNIGAKFRTGKQDF